MRGIFYFDGGGPSVRGLRKALNFLDDNAFFAIAEGDAAGDSDAFVLN